MELKNIIYRRKSVRKYTGEPVDNETIQKILDFCNQATPLDPDIQVEAKVVNRDQVRFYLPWKTPQLLAIFSEDKPGYLENVGVRHMVTQAQIDRINALARKAKTPEGLSDEERDEQKMLRELYIALFRESLVANLENTYIIDEHGNKRKVQKRK